MFDFNKAPKDALSYLQDKGYKLSFNYDEMQRQEHNHAFTVAKVTRLDLLNDIHNSLIAAMEKGTPFEQWKRELKPTLQKYGWYGKTEVTDPKTGEVKTINVDSRRLATIYNTNMRVAYAKGRYDQMMALPDSEYWRYVAILDGMTRPTHRALNGIILHRSDPFWKLNFPPNDWGCRCIVRAYSRAVIQAKGWKIHDGKNLPAGYAPHPDWAYNVGESYAKTETVYYQKAQKIYHKGTDEYNRKVFETMLDDLKYGLDKNSVKSMADDVSADKTTRNDKAVAGYIDLHTYDFLHTKNLTPSEPHIWLNKNELLHMLRESKEKAGKTLSADEIYRIPDMLNEPEMILYDTKENNVLYIYDSMTDNRMNKLVVFVNYMTGRGQKNIIKTSGKVPLKTIEVMIGSQYERIK